MATIAQICPAPEPADVRFVGKNHALPETALRYLSHAIARETELAKTVRLEMHGQIKLKRWSPFTAEESLLTRRIMVWKARAKYFGLPVRAYDAFDHGYGQTHVKLFGLIPLAWSWGANVSRSAAGRMAAESIWNPSSLLESNVVWSDLGPDQVRFTIDLFGHSTEVDLTLSPSGAIETIALQRWGTPPGKPFGLYPFGGIVDEEATFDGFTIPSRLRLGWHFGTAQFAESGEFYHVTVDRAVFAQA